MLETGSEPYSKPTCTDRAKISPPPTVSSAGNPAAPHTPSRTASDGCFRVAGRASPSVGARSTVGAGSTARAELAAGTAGLVAGTASTGVATSKPTSEGGVDITAPQRATRGPTRGGTAAPARRDRTT